MTNDKSRMHFESATEEHLRFFAEWRKVDRLEQHTCRPVVEGKRIPPDGVTVCWIFWSEEIEQPIGRFSYFDMNPRNRSAEFGYFVNPNFRRQGLGTRMLTIAIDHLFATTHLNKLYCQTGAFNTASVRLLEKLGFHLDGILREHHELDGIFWDDYLYSTLRCEWISRHLPGSNT